MQRRRRDYLMLRRFSGLMFRGRLKPLLDERIGRYQQLRTLWDKPTYQDWDSAIRHFHTNIGRPGTKTLDYSRKWLDLSSTISNVRSLVTCFHAQGCDYHP
jgi:hypothetical protein